MSSVCTRLIFFGRRRYDLKDKETRSKKWPDREESCVSERAGGCGEKVLPEHGKWFHSFSLDFSTIILHGVSSLRLVIEMLQSLWKRWVALGHTFHFEAFWADLHGRSKGTRWKKNDWGLWPANGSGKEQATQKLLLLKVRW